MRPTQLPTQPVSTPGQLRLCLLVAGPGHFATHALPDAGQAVIGRSGSTTVAIDDPSISRRHAILHLGPPLAIEDLDSSNGTRVRDVAIKPGERVEIALGEPIVVGDVTLLVQQRGTTAAQPRRIWTHGYFEGRVDEECARAAATGARFALLRVHCASRDDAAAAGDLLSAALSPLAVIASYAPGELEALIAGVGADAAAGIERAVADAAARAGVRVSIGVACWPRDGRSPHRLLSRADAVARGIDPEDRGDTGVVAADSDMIELWQLADRVAQSDVSVLLLGETGVGKERFAERIHASSRRASRPMVQINCASLPETLIESELFGHERGAFTGATAAREGLLESADGGTVFLDEIGELSLAVQAKLLRALEDRTVMRLGSTRARAVDVRFVAATNRDLEAESARGTFRSDLYFRLCGFSLEIPPLRSRRAEIMPLASRFAEQAAVRNERPVPGFADGVRPLLEAYAWPGNIRELRNVVERAILLCDDGEIRPEHLPAEKLTTQFARPAEPPAAEALTPEARRIADALAECGGNQTRAARQLGMPLRTFVNRLDALGVPRPRKGRR